MKLAIIAGISAALLACTESVEYRDAASGDQGTATDIQADEATAPSSCGNIRGGCNPEDPAACPPGQGCYSTNAQMNMFQCLPAGSGGYGSPCRAGGECLPGFQCHPQNYCIKICCDGDDLGCQTASAGGRSELGCMGRLTFLSLNVCRVVGCNPFSADTSNGCFPNSPYCALPDVGTSLPRRSFCIEHSASPPRGEGSVCQRNTDCSLGHSCFNGACVRNCAQAAAVGESGRCPAGMVCRAYSGDPTYGYCVSI
jgi:hypothetical protein